MSRTKHLILAYFIDNQDVANLINTDLKSAGYRFDHLTSKDSTLLESLGDRLISRDDPTILLVSDNFLRSAECMKNGLEFIQRLANSGNLIPVIIDGKYSNEYGGFDSVPTAFDRVSHIIKYMNYWQEKYLELRKEKRRISPAKEPEFNHKLTITRGISSNIGEFLRYLRSVRHYDLNQFKGDAYRAFFEFAGDIKGHEIFSETYKKEQTVSTEATILKGEGETKSVTNDGAGQDLVNLIQASSKDILEENEATEIPVINANEITKPEEHPPIEIGNIPGMDLLAKATGNGDKSEATGNGSGFTEPETESNSVNESENFITIDSSEEDDDLSFLTTSKVMNEGEKDVFEAELDDLSELDSSEESQTEEFGIDSILDEVLRKDSEISTDSEGEYEEDLNSIFGESPAIESDAEEKEKEDDLSEIFGDTESESEETPLEEILFKDEPEIKEEPITELPEDKLALIEDMESEVIIEEEEISISEPQHETEDAPLIENIEEAAELAEVQSEEDADEEPESEAVPETSLSDANKAFERKNVSEGLAILKSLSDENPTNTSLRYQYAFALAKYGHDFKGATQELETLLSFDDKHEDSYFLLAELAELHRDNLLAKNYFEKVENLNPNYPNIYYRMGLLALNKFENKNKEALHYLKLATKQNKKNADAHYRLGILLNEHFGKHWKAIKHFRKTLKIKPEHPFANYDLAVINHKLGDRALANDYYQKAVEVNPELKTERNDKAFEYALLDSHEEIHFSGFLNHDEDPEYTELKKDMARLEAKMAELNQPRAESQSTKGTIINEESDVISNPESIIEEERMIASRMVENEGDVSVAETFETAATELEKPEDPAKPLGKIVFITGATSGIGKATAEVFAKNGYDLILTGRREERLKDFQTKLKEDFNSNVQILPFDVRDLEATNVAFDSLTDEWKNVDILINNAGLAKGMAPIHEGNFDDWNQMIDTNLKGLLHMTRAVTPYMVKRKRGHVINVGSTSGKAVYPNGNVYCASKFAVDGLTQAMRHDLYKYNIRVSQISPAHTETEFALVRFDWDEEKAKMYNDFQPLKAEDVAESVYFIAAQPPHVNISDIVMWSTQQLSPTTINRSGKAVFEEEE